MYFSGHMIDNYSSHCSSLDVSRISEIIESFEDSNDTPQFKDKDTVKIAALVTSKKTKVTKNGETMAFLTVEDKYAEIEVIVFAKNYQKLSQLLYNENALYIVGNISQEDEGGPRILLSDAKQLMSNAEYSSLEKERASAPQKTAPAPEKRFFVKIDNAQDKRIDLIYRLAAFNKGDVPVVLFRADTRTSVIMKSIKLINNEKVFNRLCEIFGEQNVILK